MCLFKSNVALLLSSVWCVTIASSDDNLFRYEEYCLLAAARFEDGKHDEALRWCNKAIESDPASEIAYVLRGMVWHEKGKYDRALEDYSRAIHIAPTEEHTYWFRGRTRFESGEYNEAISDFTKSIKLSQREDGPHPAIYLERAQAWHRQGDIEKAIPDYGRAIAGSERGHLSIDRQVRWRAYHDRGLAWRTAGNKEQADADFNAARTLFPKKKISSNNRLSTEFPREPMQPGRPTLR